MHISLWLETPVIEVPPPPHPTVLLFVKCDIVIGLWLLIMPSGLTGFNFGSVEVDTLPWPSNAIKLQTFFKPSSF